MTRLAKVRAAATLLWRHLQNARGRPDRIWWIVRRGAEIVSSGRLRAVLARNAVHDDDEAHYGRWIALYDELDDAARERLRGVVREAAFVPRFVLVLTGAGTATQSRATLTSFAEQSYEHWEVRGGEATCREQTRLLGERSMPNANADPRGSDPGGRRFFAFVPPGDTLAKDALLRAAATIVRHPAAGVVYTDDDAIRAGARVRPRFKPDWNPEWLRTFDYIGRACFLREDVAPSWDAGEAVSPDRRWDGLLRACEAAGDENVLHVPSVAWHCDGATSISGGATHRTVVENMLARNGIDAVVECDDGACRIRYALASPPPLASIVIPTRDRADLLERCVGSIRSRSSYANYEIVIIDNESREKRTHALLDKLARDGATKVIRCPGDFNFAAECNAGVAAAAGEVVILLNNDTEVVSVDWIEELAGHASRPGVALVGALLLYPDRTIQHAGVVVGVNGIGEHRFRGRRADDPRLSPWLRHAHDVSAVTAACAAIWRDRYLALGGLDEALRVANNDIDLCLRALSRGLRNVFTPHARLVHAESASRGYENSGAERDRLARESAIVRARWRRYLDDDPAYSPSLARTGAAYALAFPPYERGPVDAADERGVASSGSPGPRTAAPSA